MLIRSTEIESGHLMRFPVLQTANLVVEIAKNNNGSPSKARRRKRISEKDQLKKQQVEQLCRKRKVSDAGMPLRR